MARYCDNDNCDGYAHTAACATADTALDMADETAIEDGRYRPSRRIATVTTLPVPRQGGAAA